MILLLFALLGLIVGLISGGSLRGILHDPLKGLLLPVFALLVKAGAAGFLPPQKGALAVCLLQYALIFAFILVNRRRPLWPLFVFIGSMMNLLVIALNGGCMPVAAGLLAGSGERLTLLSRGQIYAYCLMDESTRLPFLADVIRLGPAGVPIGFASAGDAVLCAGVALLVYQMTKAKAPPAEKKQ
jgi:hypothetical protein